jgi:hypothetical protein
MLHHFLVGQPVQAVPRAQEHHHFLEYLAILGYLVGLSVLEYLACLQDLGFLADPIILEYLADP